MSPRFHTSPATVPLRQEWPLLIVDADEVLLRFAAGLDTFLQRRDLYLDLTSYRLHGNVKRLDDDTVLIDVEVTALLDEFRTDLDWLEAVEGAQEAIRTLSAEMDVVVLSNVNAAQAEPRLRNLEALGLPMALLINSGPKGASVRALAARAGKPVIFVDDIPNHLASVAEDSPDVFRLHLIGDERLKPLLPPAPAAHFRADTWRDALAFVRARLDEAKSGT